MYEEDYEEEELVVDPFTLRADFTDHDVNEDKIQSIFYPWGVISNITSI